jgi:aminopeptidase-like protein
MTRHPELPSGHQIWQWETPYEWKVLMGESSINGGFPIAMLIARR